MPARQNTMKSSRATTAAPSANTRRALLLAGVVAVAAGAAYYLFRRSRRRKALPLISVLPKYRIICDIIGNTHAEFEELRALLDHFASTNQTTRMTRDQFDKFFNKVGIFDQELLASTFRSWDLNHDGVIDLKELTYVLDTLKNADAHERLRLLFQAYDLDGDGFISRHELEKISESMLGAAGAPVDHELLHHRVNALFNLLDKNHDDNLSLNEFLDAALKTDLSFEVCSPLFLRALESSHVFQKQASALLQ